MTTKEAYKTAASVMIALAIWVVAVFIGAALIAWFLGLEGCKACIF